MTDGLLLVPAVEVWRQRLAGAAPGGAWHSSVARAALGSRGTAAAPCCGTLRSSGPAGEPHSGVQAPHVHRGWGASWLVSSPRFSNSQGIYRKASGLQLGLGVGRGVHRKRFVSEALLAAYSWSGKGTSQVTSCPLRQRQPETPAGAPHHHSAFLHTHSYLLPEHTATNFHRKGVGMRWCTLCC